MSAMCAAVHVIPEKSKTGYATTAGRKRGRSMAEIDQNLTEELTDPEYLRYTRHPDKHRANLRRVYIEEQNNIEEEMYGDLRSSNQSDGGIYPV